MKLLMISGDRSILAGKKSAFYYTLEEFSKHWERIDVICPAAAGIENSELRIQNVFFHPSPKPSFFSQPSWILNKGSELFHAHHHAVMTVHEYPPFYNGIGALRLKKKTGIAAASEIHHVVGYPHAASFTELVGKVLSRLFLPKLLKSFDAVRVVNTAVKEQLQRWGVDSQKITVVPSFYLDKADFQFASEMPEKKYKLAFCARLEPNKGLMELLEILSHPDMAFATLLVIGDGSERGKAEGFVAAHGMQNRVTFVGWLPTKQDVYAAIRSAKVFVMNSKSEGGPRVALEALACSVPVIATPVGVMPEVIHEGQNGLLTDGSTQSLHAAIRSLLDDKGWQRHMAEQSPDILSLFDRSQLISRYADFLQSLR